jgi:MFS family permease
MKSQNIPPSEKSVFGVNRSIFLLGFVSFLTDLSSEMIFSVFSIFLTVILGASAALLGIIEGMADFAASSLDYLAGFLSDRTGKRKTLAILGYGFSTLAKTILILQATLLSAASFRVIERLGKSFRGAPRDAWISSIADRKNAGFSFGIHKAMDKSGAILGPIGAYFILSRLGENASAFKDMFRIALIPAALAVLLLFFVAEKPALPAKKENLFRAYKTLGPGFKHYFYTAGIFSLAYFSFSFLLLKAYAVGFAIQDVTLLYALFNVSFVFTAPLLGKLGDRIGRRKIIALEYVLYLAMCVGFMLASAKWQVVALFLIFGIFYAIDESQSKAYITDMEKSKPGTAIGVYNFFTGLIYLPASIIAGALWKLNPNYAFGFGGLVSALAFVFFLSGKAQADRLNVSE